MTISMGCVSFLPSLISISSHFRLLSFLIFLTYFKFWMKLLGKNWPTLIKLTCTQTLMINTIKPYWVWKTYAYLMAYLGCNTIHPFKIGLVIIMISTFFLLSEGVRGSSRKEFSWGGVDLRDGAVVLNGFIICLFNQFLKLFWKSEEICFSKSHFLKRVWKSTHPWYLKGVCLTILKSDCLWLSLNFLKAYWIREKKIEMNFLATSTITYLVMYFSN